MELLLQKGEIEQMSSQQTQIGSSLRRDERVTNDRYDELISAFNEILKEILRQGKLRSEHRNTMESGDQNYNLSKYAYSPTKTSNCTEKDSRDRCLNRNENELLRKIRMLDNQLNAFMRNSENKKTLTTRNAPEIDSNSQRNIFNHTKKPIYSQLKVNHSDKRPVMNNHNKPEQIIFTEERNSSQNMTQSKILMSKKTVISEGDLPAHAEFMIDFSIGKRDAQAPDMKNSKGLDS